MIPANLTCSTQPTKPDPTRPNLPRNGLVYNT
ncbi:uncharacterized protein ANIA_11640 [Aspergillus nidulans FGSC A4]|uniref:Uncharacterized protein n=1 Tax=Emericella nidulans (strain FGSC A4 / ATCC 38163 / CBS 112.46 / NRRL 194 / M139) TaxID=227321 RepID=C8VH93_EMENI|nr:hypothetical protein [Aspergillus nidulans FGSC A4]CBF82638.1 TPA: hypothetical protein ANIA_11640 [Aspergillus nidulans FGSC A4]